MDILYGQPFTGRRLAELSAFLERCGLSYAEGVDFSVLLYDGDELVGTGSLDGNVIKCVAVSETRMGENLTATILTELQRTAFLAGKRHLFLYTKPRNAAIFGGFGFYEVAAAPDCLLMENLRGGAAAFVRSLETPDCGGVVGCVVANCNPFTNGHRYLIETAARQCGLLHVFVLSEDKALVPAADRLRLVREGTADLPNVSVHETGGYLVSAATFPDYFLREKARVSKARCALDLAVFTRYFIEPLHMQKRFVGTEPYSPVTAAYNAAMKAALPAHGVEVVELPRLEVGGAPVSASRVRALLEKGDYAAILPLVPPVTYQYLLSKR